MPPCVARYAGGREWYRSGFPVILETIHWLRTPIFDGFQNLSKNLKPVNFDRIDLKTCQWKKLLKIGADVCSQVYWRWGILSERALCDSEELSLSATVDLKRFSKPVNIDKFPVKISKTCQWTEPYFQTMDGARSGARWNLNDVKNNFCNFVFVSNAQKSRNRCCLKTCQFWQVCYRFQKSCQSGKIKNRSWSTVKSFRTSSSIISHGVDLLEAPNCSGATCPNPAVLTRCAEGMHYAESQNPLKTALTAF